MVTFGGLLAHTSDDLNKVPWMLRVAASAGKDAPREFGFLDFEGRIRVDALAPPRLRLSLVYRLCMHRFGEKLTERDKPLGFDRARRQEVADKEVELHRFEESFTSKNWLVRIYKLLPDAEDEEDATLGS